MWKFKSWQKKDKWLFVLTLGAILCILAFPTGRVVERTSVAARQTGVGGTTGIGSAIGLGGTIGIGGTTAIEGDPQAAEAVANASATYEEQLQQRVKDVLKNVDGVGEVDVLIVLKSSSEKVIHMDEDSADSISDENDGNGLVRKNQTKERNSATVLTGGSGENVPIVEKELYPELSGIVISATGGGSPKIQEEISTAMEALFGLPAHKIKVLKRVE